MCWYVVDATPTKTSSMRICSARSVFYERTSGGNLRDFKIQTFFPLASWIAFKCLKMLSGVNCMTFPPFPTVVNSSTWSFMWTAARGAVCTTVVSGAM